MTPDSFYNELGKKHIKFKNIVESLYLDKKYFTPDKKVLDKININNQKYVLLRFVSWDSHHDFGENGLSINAKRKI